MGRASSKGRKGIADLLKHHALLEGKHHLFPLTQKSWITELQQKFKVLAVTFTLPLISVYMKAFEASSESILQVRIVGWELS